MGMLAVYLLCDGLIHRNGQNEFAVVFAFLHLILEPRFLFHLGILKFLGSDIIESKSEFLIFVILIIVAIVEVGAFFCLNHLFHQFDGRIVLPAISSPFRFYYHFLQGLWVGLDFDVEILLGRSRYGDCLGSISHGTECEHPTFMAGDSELSVDIGCHGHVVNTGNDRGIRNGSTGGLIEDIEYEW